MTTFDAKVSFYDTREAVFAAVLAVTSGELTVEIDGRVVGTWPVGQLSLAVVDGSIVVSVEGERLLVEAADLAALRSALRVQGAVFEGEPAHPGGLPHLYGPPAGEGGSPSAPRGRHVARRTVSTQPQDRTQRLHGVDVSIDLRAYEEPSEETGEESFVKLLRHELRDLENALAVARTQLRWVEDLTPRMLPIPLRDDETGLGVVRRVRLKERRTSHDSDESQPWIGVDWGNAYVTDRRLLFCGVSDVEFEFTDIERKGASRTGLLLGVSSREGSHLLEGPGERLAVVLTAAEKIAIGLDPTLPFKETISRLTAEIDTVSRRLGSEADLPADRAQALDLPVHSA